MTDDEIAARIAELREQVLTVTADVSFATSQMLRATGYLAVDVMTDFGTDTDVADDPRAWALEHIARRLNELAALLRAEAAASPPAP